VETFIAGFILMPYAHSVAVTIVVVILTFFSLVLGELLPKRIGLNHLKQKQLCYAYENGVCCDGAVYLVVDQ
jgi:CBS domain containing-hemolysin-like protein